MRLLLKYLLRVIRILGAINSAWSIALSALLFIGLVMYFGIHHVTSLRGESNGYSSMHMNRQTTKEGKLTSNSKLIAGQSAHYPDLPTEFRVPLGKIDVLIEAENRHEIVAWADAGTISQYAKLVSIQTTKPSADWLVVMYIGTSGAQRWTVHLYAYYPVNAGDKKPWKLLYLGNGVVSTKKLDDIQCIYIDTAKSRSLLFAKRTGEVIKVIPIEKELELFESRKHSL